MKTVAFTRMDEGTAAEYALLAGYAVAERAQVADRVLGLLRQMEGPMLGYRIDRYRHSLQTATRAARDGADEETVVCALLHDIGDILAPDNHSAFAAAVLRPYVSERNHWIVLHHGIFQGYYYFHQIGRDRDAREEYRGHEWFGACAEFCERWDQTSFDPDYDDMPLDAFEPMLRRLFAKEPRARV